MHKVYIVAFSDGEKTEIMGFKTKELRESFIQDLKDNQYSFCTAEAVKWC